MNEKKTNDARKTLARLLYTEHDQCVKEVAFTISADETDVRRWIQEEAWDMRKRSLLTSKKAQLKQLYALLEALSNNMNNEEQKNAKDVDLYLKYTAAVKNLESDVPVAAIIEVGALFINWLRRKDVELTRTIALQYNTFVDETLAPPAY